MTRPRTKTRSGRAPAAPPTIRVTSGGCSLNPEAVHAVTVTRIGGPLAFPDPVCVAGPKGTPCDGCHWCLRRARGPVYWLGPDPTDATIDAALELLAPDAGPPKPGPRRKR
jgi:hypothetical protein